jgi:hypothetical protein
MKPTILFAILAISTPAFAGQKVVCKDMNAGPDHGYTAYLPLNMDEAVVSEATIAGEQEIASMRCAHPKGDGQMHPDQMRVLSLCYDGNYKLSIRAGGLSGRTFALFGKGKKQLAQMLCQKTRR